MVISMRNDLNYVMSQAEDQRLRIAEKEIHAA
jgi:hypothetical protein